MSKRWPVVRVGYGPYEIEAYHTLPHAMNPEGATKHSHQWSVFVICESEIQPRDGWTWDSDEMQSKVAPILEQLNGADLNTLMSMPPTTEALALYLLEILPGWVEGIRLERSGGFWVETTRKMNGRRSFSIAGKMVNP